MQKISLPIDPYLESIANGINQNQNLILTAPPGSGKTTRVPAHLTKAFKKIIVLVPKRIAAVSAAARIAEENNWKLGEDVGYQVRFENVSSLRTRLIFMTEGVFIKKLQDPKMWDDLDLVIFDEFHERSSHIDLSIGICLEKQILEQKIKMLVMSATLNVKPLQKYLQEAVLVTVETKPFPLEIIRSKKSQRLNIDFQFIDQLIEILQEALNKSKRDVLIFLPGLSEIRFVEKNISNKFKNVEFCILHGSIKLEEQRKILQESTHSRIILSTNVAESSITLPSVDCVIDAGLVKKSVTESKIGFKKLEPVRISLFSAKQRAGRAARIRPGVCYQMWHELDERSMPATIAPEIMSSDLLEESLTLISLGIENPDQFSWLDRPKKNFSDAIEQLKKWGLYQSEKGHLVQSAPLDIERGLVFVEMSELGFQKDVSRLLAFIETTNFDSLNEPINLEDLKLNDLGKKIESQLNRISIKVKASVNRSFKDSLISLFFKELPHKVAKRKEKNLAVSSLGRGLEMSPSIVNSKSDYFLLFSGREISSAMTKCDFALSFTQQEFDRLSNENISAVSEFGLDTEKMKIFKVEKKMVGYFVISESPRTYLTEGQHPELFQKYFTIHFDELLKHHEHYKNYVTKIQFLKSKKEFDYTYLDGFQNKIQESVNGSIRSIEEFFNINLYEILLYLTPEDIRNNLSMLPTYFTLPSGKQIKIDYESELSPKVSARIQEFFGIKTHPVILNDIRLTLELLAPNHRPAQVTSQLENFWKNSYHDVKKDLKARYPKHAWPDDPANFDPSQIRNKK